MASSKLLAKVPDRRLLSDERADLKAEILETVGKNWLVSENVWLNNRAPSELIGTSEEYKVRDILRSFRSAGLS